MAYYNIIDYITIASTGNATDFGDRTTSGAVNQSIAACASSTRGVIGGGIVSNVMDYVTIASTGNATDFGDLTAARYALTAAASPTRGVFFKGTTVANTMDYITIASTGNATDFGDDQVGPAGYQGACSNGTRGTVGGGNGASNVIAYLTIASTGNTTDFGDLTVGRNTPAALSGSA